MEENEALPQGFYSKSRQSTTGKALRTNYIRSQTSARARAAWNRI